MPIKELLDGYRRFKDNRYKEQVQLYEKLHTKGQKPRFLFISCCDSRVDPSTIVDASPGDLFIVRNVANLVPPCTPDGGHHGTSAALEFAVKHLEIEHIIVMGHASCGGANALLQSTGMEAGPEDFIFNWMNLAKEARDKVIIHQGKEIDEDLQTKMEHELVRFSLKNLMTFDWIRERVEANKLDLHGWYFGIEKGVLYNMDQESQEFVAVDL